MAVKYINPYLKKQSGIIVTGKEIEKLDYILSEKTTKQQFKSSFNNLKKSLKIIKNVNRNI